jgi:hypothetical protein
MDTEEQIRRTRICLAEIGLEEINIEVIGHRPGGGEAILGTDSPISPAVGYQVGYLLSLKAGEPICCWACWLEEYQQMKGLAAADCREGRCHNPGGPSKPPREMLVGL